MLVVDKKLKWGEVVRERVSEEREREGGLRPERARRHFNNPRPQAILGRGSAPAATPHPSTEAGRAAFSNRLRLARS